MERHSSGGPDVATADLLERARAGDDTAFDELFARHLPRLRHWASGKLPRWARDITDTQDLAQETCIATLRQLDRFRPQGDGALQAYLRRALMNRIRNELRRHARRPAPLPLDSAVPDSAVSPLEARVGSEMLERYEAALMRLEPGERDAIVARVELGLSFAEAAVTLDKPSADAARMAVMRALVRLAEEMNRG